MRRKPFLHLTEDTLMLPWGHCARCPATTRVPGETDPAAHRGQMETHTARIRDMSHLYSPSQEAPPEAVLDPRVTAPPTGRGARSRPSGLPVSSPLDPSGLQLRGADLWGTAVRFESQGNVPEN